MTSKTKKEMQADFSQMLSTVPSEDLARAAIGVHRYYAKAIDDLLHDVLFARVPELRTVLERDPDARDVYVKRAAGLLEITCATVCSSEGLAHVRQLAVKAGVVEEASSDTVASATMVLSPLLWPNGGEPCVFLLIQTEDMKQVFRVCTLLTSEKEEKDAGDA